MPSGRLMVRINYSHGTHDGHCEIYHDSDSLALDLIYFKGYLEGVSTMYYPCTNLIQKVTFKQKRLHGSDILYDENGNIVSYYVHNKGELKTVTVFNRDLNVSRINILTPIFAGNFEWRSIETVFSQKLQLFLNPVFFVSWLR